MLAGLPKAPSAYNPVTNPKRAKTRQQYVLRRMHDLKFITDTQFQEAQIAPLNVRQGVRDALPTHAEAVAEMARQVVFEGYGEDAYTKGITVWTTVRRADQESAYVGGASRRHRIRPAPRLPGPGSLCQPPDGPGRGRTGDGKRVCRRGRQRQSESRGRPCRQRQRSHGGAGQRRHRFGHRGWTQVRCAQPDGQIPGQPAYPAGRRDPPVPGRQGALDDRSTAAGGSGIRRRAAGRRRNPGIGRRIRSRPQQVQSRDAGVSPAGFGIQAVHLFGGAGKGVFAGHRHQRCALLRARRASRRRGLGTQELRRQVRRPDAAAQCAGQVQESRHRSCPAGDRTAIRAGLHRAVRLRPQAAPALPDHGPRRRLGHPDANGGGLCHFCERRLSRGALPHREGDRRSRHRAVGGQLRWSPARTPSAPSIRATHSS